MISLLDTQMNTLKLNFYHLTIKKVLFHFKKLSIIIKNMKKNFCSTNYFKILNGNLKKKIKYIKIIT